MALSVRKRPAKTSKLAKTKKPARQSMDLKEFWRSLQNLDMQNYGNWPTAVKIFIILMLLLFIAALAYALPISKKIDEIQAAEAEEQTLLDTYREKESKARHLEEYRRQVAQMEVEFNALLDQLPKDTRVSELVEGINMTGVGSGIRFQDISIEPEVEQELFIEQPIRIAAVGEYHQFGSFISGIAALPRIITMHDFEVSNPQPTLETFPELTLVLNTKTYRSKEIEETPPAEGETESEAGE